MRVKNAIAVIIGGFALASAAYLVFTEVRATDRAAALPAPNPPAGPAAGAVSATPSAPPAPAPDGPKEPTEKPVPPNNACEECVVVYWFYDDNHCPSCEIIERYTKDVLQKDFAGPLESGFIRYVPINVSDPVNQHYVYDYRLYAKSVVLSRRREGKEVDFKNLEYIWRYLRDEKGFKSYLRGEIHSFLSG